MDVLQHVLRCSMNYRQQLNEYIQDKIGQCVPFLYDHEITGDKFVIRLTVGTAIFSISNADSILSGKEDVAHRVLTELRPLQTEAEVPQRLGLSVVQRNPCVNIIRQELRQIRQHLKRCGKKSAFSKLARIYPVLDWVEQELVEPPTIADTPGGKKP